MNAAIYIRNKTNNHNDNPCHTSQQMELQEWCETHKHSIVKVYRETEPTSSGNQRPVLQRLIDDACLPNAPFGAVIVKNYDRISRDVREFFLCKERLNKYGIKLLSAEQPETEPDQKHLAAMYGLINEYQRAQHSSLTRRGMLENARNGFFNGGQPPYGYSTVEAETAGEKGKRKRLAIDDSEAVIVRRIFQLFQEASREKAISFEEIAKRLNRSGIQMRGRSFTGRQIGKALRNPLYMGEYVFNKGKLKGGSRDAALKYVRIAVEPIIHPETFRVVQDRLSEARKTEE